MSLTLGVYCYYIIIHYILYYTIIIYYILYYTLYIIYYITIIISYTYTILYYTILFYSHLPLSSLLLLLLSSQSSSTFPIPYNTHLLSSLPLFPFSSFTILPSDLSSFPYQLIHSILVGTYIYLFIFKQDIISIPLLLPNILPLQSSTDLISFIFCSQFCSYSPFHQYSFYTCRYLHILIYILLLFIPNHLTPHVLSEWMVEV